MHRYYIEYYKDFGNTYNLFSVDLNNPSDISAENKLKDRFERITLKEAKEKIREEKERRKSDPYFSGFASTSFLPIRFYGKM